MDDLGTLLSEESFQNWLSGTASAEETVRWESWLNESPDNKKLHQAAQRVWQMGRYRSARPVDIEQEWARLEKRLQFDRTSVAAEVRQPNPKIRSFGERRHRGSRWSFGAVTFAAAAVMVVILIHNYLTSSKDEIEPPQEQLVSTEYGQRANLDLPDGTRIILNANSTLKYPAVWKPESARRITLQGEAYFDVAKASGNAPQEFAVSTSDGLIKVLGTRFAVRERGTGTRVVVEEGGVQVTSFVDLNKKAERDVHLRLQAGQMVNFQKGSSELRPFTVDVRPFTTWWRQQLILHNTSFRSIVERLEETYGVTVHVPDKSLLERTLSGSIENQNLMVVTDALANALRVPVRREGGVITYGD